MMQSKQHQWQCLFGPAYAFIAGMGTILALFVATVEHDLLALVVGLPFFALAFIVFGRTYRASIEATELVIQIGRHRHAWNLADLVLHGPGLPPSILSRWFLWHGVGSSSGLLTPDRWYGFNHRHMQRLTYKGRVLYISIQDVVALEAELAECRRMK